MPKVTIIQAMESLEQQEKIRVGAYCRVSSAKAVQRHSCEAQQNYFRQLLSDSSHEKLVNIYTDYSSGTSAEGRSDFLQMLEDCRNGKIDRIITKSLSRFARNTKECLVILRELKQLGVTVLFDKEGIDTSRVSDEMLLTILESLAQEESASISNNVRWSLKKKMADGTLGIARVPYGYRKDSKKQLVVDETTASVVQRIYRLYLSGNGAQMIADLFNQEGIPSPTGILWNNVTILKMLRQEKYIGDIRWQKTYSVFMGVKGKINRGEQESYYVRNCLPPIISREDFIAAQALRRKNTHMPRRVTCSPFRGKTKCTCGRSYYYAEKGIRSLWICSGKRQPQRPCTNKNFSDADYRAAWDRLCRKLRKFACEILLPCILQLQYLDHHAVSDEIKALEEQQKELLQRRYVLCELCANGCISQEKLFCAEREIVQLLQVIQNCLEQYTNSYGKTAEQLEKLYQLITTETDPDILSEKILLRTVTDGCTAVFELMGGLVLKEALV